VRHVVQDEPDDAFMLRPDFQRGIASLARFDLAYDILIYPRQLPAAIQLARAFPKQRFVLDHLAKPEIRARRIEPWAAGLRELARSPNVAAKLSGLVTEAHWTQWQASDLAPYVGTALEAFGPQRLLIGSDWPVCTLAGEYRVVMNAATELLKGLSSDERAAVLGENARRIYLRGGRAGFNAPSASRVDALAPPTAP
jgi:L-fuconolactonase